MAGHLLPGPHPALVPARPDAAGPPVTLGDAVLQARGLPPEPPPLNHALEPAADAEMGGERKRNSKMCLNLNVFHGPRSPSSLRSSTVFHPSTFQKGRGLDLLYGKVLSMPPSPDNVSI